MKYKFNKEYLSFQVQSAWYIATGEIGVQYDYYDDEITISGLLYLSFSETKTSIVSTDSYERGVLTEAEFDVLVDEIQDYMQENKVFIEKLKTFVSGVFHELVENNPDKDFHHLNWAVA